VSPACGFRAERGKADADTAALFLAPGPGVGWWEGARISGMTLEALSTGAACAGGPARSSGEPAVMAGERRGRVICGWFVWSTGKPGRSCVSELKPAGKPFEISKWEVQGAWEKVKANKGAPGVDGVALAEFEADLKNNLYKIWNRMSSGSYFPPPVLAVEIPKPHGGGTRILGVPTEAA